MSPCKKEKSSVLAALMLRNRMFSPVDTRSIYEPSCTKPCIVLYKMSACSAISACLGVYFLQLISKPQILRQYKNLVPSQMLVLVLVASSLAEAQTFIYIHIESDLGWKPILTSQEPANSL